MTQNFASLLLLLLKTVLGGANGGQTHLIIIVSFDFFFSTGLSTIKFLKIDVYTHSLLDKLL